ncbi:MAG TPA: Nif3-like dinuclear metal center hexameric protein [Symbiobacteriaceae bacterium]|nr:Nif3-like dinuclear metal center hexameric protein [Symbiobacteriaceae bacterium]
MAEGQTTVNDVLEVLDRMTGGRVVRGIDGLFGGKNRFVVTKTSHIPGKAVVETPGLVYGNPEARVRKIALCMTLTESNIELAGAMGMDLIIAHHPIADAANSGGVPLKGYLELYGLAAMELHEAFHGLHPGLAYLHGHAAFRTEIAYGGVPGNILFVGRALEGVNTLGRMLDRLADLMGYRTEEKLLAAECEVRGCTEIMETSVAAQGKILVGRPDDPMRTVLHIFPHTGFTPAQLEQAKREHPEADTVLATISRVRPGHPLVEKARELGMNFVVGNSHAVEILENWMPFAKALQHYLPDVELRIFRERVSAIPVESTGTPAIEAYAQQMAGGYLIKS